MSMMDRRQAGACHRSTTNEASSLLPLQPIDKEEKRETQHYWHSLWGATNKRILSSCLVILSIIIILLAVINVVTQRDVRSMDQTTLVVESKALSLTVTNFFFLRNGNDDDDDDTVLADLSSNSNKISHHGYTKKTSSLEKHDNHPAITNYSGDDPSYYKFPEEFVWGAATSSYQIEGAVMEDGRGPTIWDAFCQQNDTILDHSNGSVACDHYHRMKHDVALIKSLNIKAYRFSIAWSRILPNGSTSLGPVNQAGIDFYNALIDELLANDIEPWVTLFHWDLPLALEEAWGGWLDRRTVRAFKIYARICFAAFGDRVTHWVTMNEAWTVAVNGYATGVHAPGRQSPTEPYLVGHHLLLAHAVAVKAYRNDFAAAQNGMIGLTNCGDFRYPATPKDYDAAERAMLFQFGWFTDPILLGDYPPVMRDMLGDRLPTFTPAERELLIGSIDFIGLNYYSSLLAKTPFNKTQKNEGYWNDMHIDFSFHPAWKFNAMGWSIVPDGLREMLGWISQRYGNSTLIFVTENGSAEDEPTLDVAVNDEKRRSFFECHLRACAQALEGDDGMGMVNLGGYFAWSLMDNFEWQFGYTRRFGICRVDFDTEARTPKLSANWYSKTITHEGRNIARQPPNKWHPSMERRLLGLSRRRIPDRVLIGYGSDVNKVRTAVLHGVNVVIWSFLRIEADEYPPLKSATHNGRQSRDTMASIRTNLDLDLIRMLIIELDYLGFDQVLHLVSVGGWNGPHVDSRISASDWYKVFETQVGDIFHGLDWDLEGNDDMTSPYNCFTVEGLDKVGEISRLAKENGFVVTMAPPQSYLDIDESRFSRMVNLTDPLRPWHADFSWYGANVYAYLLERYGNSLDLISVQFYESFSRAADAIFVEGLRPQDYIESYIERLYEHHESLHVEFSSDNELNMPNSNVRLPLEKLVIGLGNGWAMDPSDKKKFFIQPDQIQQAWDALLQKGQLPRGLMFWTINLEGVNNVFFARDLSRIIHGGTEGLPGTDANHEEM